MTRLFAAAMDSPLGAIHLRVDPQGVLVALDFDEGRERIDVALKRRFEDVAIDERADVKAISVIERLKAYFAGSLGAIDTIAVDGGGTSFQQACWLQLRLITAGTTTSYLDQAKAVGRPAAVRAVGQANGANPIPLVVPCHRVIAANGSLGGYSAGLSRKTWLLAHEARYCKSASLLDQTAAIA